MTSVDTIVGRARELAALEAVTAVAASGQTAVVHGRRGIGKTTLLHHACERATPHYPTVVRMTANAADSAFDYDGLRQLLRLLKADPAGILDAADSRTGTILLRAFDERSKSGPVLLSIDDVDLLDRPSLDAVLFAIRRTRDRPVTTLLGASRVAALQGLPTDAVPIDVAPLSLDAAHRLLSSRPQASRGFLANSIVAQSAGVPAALIGFHAAVSLEFPGQSPTEPLPLPRRVQAMYLRELEGLDHRTRSALITLAAARSDELSELRLDGTDAAESLGMIRIINGHQAFTDPLLRSAVYHAATVSARADAHQRVAAMLTTRPLRQLWHRCHAASTSDEALASNLERSSASIFLADGSAAAAAALHRAADLSINAEDKVRRLLGATGYARRGADVTWGCALAGQALALADDRHQRHLARTELALAAVWDTDHRNTAEILSEETPVSARALATLAFLTDDAAIHGAPDGLFDPHPLCSATPAETVHVAEHVATRWWRRATCAPLTATVDDREALIRTIDTTSDPVLRNVLGATAWLTNASDLAVHCLTTARPAVGDTSTPPSDGVALMALARAQLETGRFNSALQTTHDLQGLARFTGQPLFAAVAHLTEAAIATYRGDLVTARNAVTAASSTFDPPNHRALGAWRHHVNGLICMTASDFTASYAHLSALFDDRGAPLHRRESYLALADYATAAVLSGHTTTARRHLALILEHLPVQHPPRIKQLIAHANGLLAEPNSTGPLYAAGLSEDRGHQWPLERARLQLSHGGWLRRQRNVKDAQLHLAEALAVLTSLRVEPWIDLCHRELRSAGVRPTTVGNQITATLSPQEHHVAYLVSLGWTNPQIATHLRLSPRTVAGHLYRSFPKLGVTRRTQIRDIPPPRSDLGSMEPPAADT